MKTLLGLALFSQVTLGVPLWTTPDFVILPPGPRTAGTPTNCRKHIEQVICSVKPAGPSDPIGTDRPCQPGSKQFAPPFQELHDAYPPALQKMFCSLDRIYVESQFIGTAYAGLDPTSGRAVIGIRQSALDQELSLHQWSSWKEQLSFGGETADYALTPGLPIVSTRLPKGANDFLYFVIAHEFGHLFDFANRLNAMDPQSCTGQGPETECAFRPGTWGRLGWETNLTPRRHNRFWGRRGLCFYWCDGTFIPAGQMGRLYGGLYGQSDFISTYGSTNYGDDFAEALAYYALDEARGRYYLDTTQGHLFNPLRRLHSPTFRPKYSYLRRFLRGAITYP